MSVLSPVAAARQSPLSAAAQAASVGADPERPAQAGAGQTTQPDAEKAAAPLRRVLVSTGESAEMQTHTHTPVHTLLSVSLQCSILSSQNTNCVIELTFH